MGNTIRILLADDHPMVREGLKASLDGEDGIEVVADVCNGRDALDKAMALKPDVVLLDVSMPVMGGLEAATEFRKTQPNIKVLILSMHEDREYILKMVQNGVTGYVLKDVAAEEIVMAIQTVHRGGTYFSSGASQQLFGQFHPDDIRPQAKLTPREERVLQLLAEGCCNKDIARKLDISVRTAEAHRHNMKQKLKIKTSAGLIRYAVERRMVHV
ncbi:response regulator transcription factor [Sansalvadorimonas verongulae]|uniref:response regulator transcription factor n=1 Tax=Sansalvadorimonas verongulae TaxID=2172824 RepID=UPI0012BC1CB4|nr:response regulator transcription factor [Sansalvadorimonas verongulae]MTI15568.1 response regulator transcription factor [Sansalvadorimonas verongulae]